VVKDVILWATRVTAQPVDSTTPRTITALLPRTIGWHVAQAVDRTSRLTALLITPFDEV
jgi:hypothetical protein